MIRLWRAFQRRDSRRALLRRVIPWAGLLAYASLIFYISSIKAAVLPDTGDFGLDKVAHFAAYFVLTLFVVWAVRRLWPDLDIVWVSIAAGLAVTAFGIIDERHQILIPIRRCSFGDFIADFVGMNTAILAFIARNVAAR